MNLGQSLLKRELLVAKDGGLQNGQVFAAIDDAPCVQ